MKAYISADMEGVSGIVSLKQTSPGSSDYQRGRELMTQEVNTVVEALYQEGAQEIIINDAHNTMDNILIENLHPRAKLISGHRKPLSMMEGIDGSFDAAFFIGYHARPGTSSAIIDHTYTFRILEAKVNGISLSEAGLNGRLAGYYGVPVALVSGDQQTIACAREELNNPVGLVVKESIGRETGILTPFSVVKDKICVAIKEAVERIDSLEPTRAEGDLELEVTFTLAEMAKMAMLIPGVNLKADRTIIYETDDYKELFQVFRAMLFLTDNIK